MLTVEQAMRMLTEHPPHRSKSRPGRGGVWPNPEITYEREAMPNALDTQEEYLLLSQRFELSGR